MIFVLSGLPMPPSSNNAYATNRKTGCRFPSQELKAFKKAIEDWRAARPILLRDARAALVSMRPTDQKVLRVDRFFGFPHQRVFTLAGLPKRMDVSNRIKAIDDVVADMLGIDDSWFFGGTEIKCISDEPSVTLVLRLVDVRAIDLATSVDLTLAGLKRLSS